MNGQSIAPLRYVTSASLKDIYDADKEGFDAVVDGPDLQTLSDENDRVSGTERFYNYLLQDKDLASPDFGGVSGNESLLDSIKRGLTTLIQHVKDFFKWIWSFFSAKEEKINNSLDDTLRNLKSKGLEAGDVKYPRDAFTLYNKPGKPDGNLGWLGDVNKQVSKGITNVESYSIALEEQLTKLAKDAMTETPSVDALVYVKNFEAKLKTIFSVKDKKATFITKDDFTLTATRMSYRPVGATRKQFEGATFTTTLGEAESIAKDAGNNLQRLKALTLDLQKLEKTMISTLKATVDKSAKANNAVGKIIGEIIRYSMQNIKDLELVLYKTLNTISNIVKAATA